MYARSTTVIGDPSRIDDGIAFVRDELWPAIRDMDGCRGISLLVDRLSGRCIATTSWETEDALAASRRPVLPLRDRGVATFGAKPPVVEEWEIASMHRLHPTEPGTCVRVGWSRVPHTHVDRALEFYRSTLMPQIEQLEGFDSASLMIDRATGRGVTSVAFESRAAMERTRDQADYLRESSTQEANVETLDVAEFDLAFAHLHVPELV
jgi:hypothetical protein